MPDTSPDAEQRRLRCADLVLAMAQDGPAALGVFTDEELRGLDGVDTPQLVPMPWVEETEDHLSVRDSASVALRGLLARRLVLPVEDLVDGPEDLTEDTHRLYAADPVQGILTLRRTFLALLTFQRLVAGQVHTIVQYVYGGDIPTVLEEEITADGFHHFFALPPEVAVDHVLTLIDQDEVAGAEGEPRELRSSEAEQDAAFAALMADTRALTVASLVSREGPSEQMTFYATSDSLTVSRSDADPAHPEATADPMLEVLTLSRETARALIASLLATAQNGETQNGEAR